MGGELKQSTAHTFQLGPFLDETNGKDAEASLTIGDTDCFLSKHGGAAAAKNDTTDLTGTGDARGYYDCVLNTTDTGTLGTLKVMVHVAGALPVWETFEVVTANWWDSKYATDELHTHTVEMTAGVIAAATLGADCITNAKIADNALNTENFAGDFLDATLIADDAIVAANLATGALTADAFAADALVAATFATGAFTADAFAANALVAATFAADCITNAKIADNALNTENFAADFLDATLIADDAIVAANLATGAFTADAFAANAIVAATLNADCITAAKIAPDAIEANMLATGALTADAFAADALVAATFATDSITSDALATSATGKILDAQEAITGDTLSLETMMTRVYMRLAHEVNVTDADGSAAIRNSGDTGDVATGSITDAAGTTSQAKWSWT